MVDLEEARVVLGDTNRCEDDLRERGKDSSRAYDIQDVTFHYAYDECLIDSDIVLIRLKEKVTLGHNVQIIPLAQEGQHPPERIVFTL
jgi:hypothetical protein